MRVCVAVRPNTALGGANICVYKQRATIIINNLHKTAGAAVLLRRVGLYHVRCVFVLAARACVSVCV